MSEEYKVTLPKLGESIVSATIVQWFKKEGDTVNLDEPLLEVSTDKVNSEIPAPAAGVITSITAAPDQELQVGDLLATIQLHAGHHADAPLQAAIQKQPSPATTTGDMKDVFSPALLRLAREQGISLEELERIPSTGAAGRLTKRDVEIYLENKKPPEKNCPFKQSNAPDIERVKMSGMRKAIADNMVRSFYEAPHATLITEVDVTDIVKLIQKEKEAFLAKNGVKLTITAFAARAIAKALREYPLLNSSLEGDTICVKRFVNIGIAVSVDQGIMVPVVKNCQTISFAEMAKNIGDLSSRARAGTLAPHEVQDGTITLTNFGISGVEIGIPIIRHTEVAIVGMGAIHKKVVVLEDDLFGVRSMMNISLSFDHRVLDGMYGCGFLKALKEHLEKDQTT
ncbi:MAG: 2-oxo acid dehydrogenase subunit E2 [Rhabdochlamydiaceae bacterium]|jgi:2-oxoglutarate dehydrogenase E2 component (dihydrolipoamide succinyltransferase)